MVFGDAILMLLLIILLLIQCPLLGKLQRNAKDDP